MPVQFNRELQFGKSMTNSRFNALVVTLQPKCEKETYSMRGRVARVTVHARAGGSNWTLENLPEMSHVLIYGITAATNVNIDGSVLPKVIGTDPISMPIGWKVDPASNRLVIHLPSRQAEHSEQITEIEVDFDRG